MATLRGDTMTTWVMDSEFATQEGPFSLFGVEKVHCAVFKELNQDNWTTFSGGTIKQDLTEFFSQQGSTYVGHNILGADFHVFQTVLGIPYSVAPDSVNGAPCKFIDTLSLSRRLYPDRPLAYYKGKSCGSHGLNAWGVRLGILKPVVEDWRDQSLEVYIHRASEDVKINEATYIELLKEVKR